MKIRRVLLAGVAFVALSATGMSSGIAAVLEEELRDLVDNHPQLQSARKTSAAAKEGIRGAFSGYYPKVSVNGDVGPEYVDTPSRRSDNNEAYYTGRDTAGITVTQKLFDGFATQSSVESARLTSHASNINVEQVRQTVMLEGAKSYLNVLRQNGLIELAKNNEGNIQTQLNLEDERVKRGSGIAVDVLQAKSRLQLAKERRVSFEGAFVDARSRYTQVFNRAPEVGSMNDPQPDVGFIPATLEETIAIALKENPAIETSDTQVQSAREKRRAARAGYYPTLSLEGKANYEDNKNTVKGIRRDWTLLLKANWDLFSGFSTQAAVAQAAFDYSGAKDNLDYTKRKVVEQTKIAWQALLTARERVELLENAVNIATEVWESRKKLREAGKETVINVLDAENEIYNARINYVNASFDARTAIYDLLSAMGRLDLDSVHKVAAK
ncbi:MAG: TolC family outer membrane protein [Alphaproteobacteria bacterium]|nr:TolC family outer membrane protein [Alphaproteobacteria bacterium]